MIPLPQNPLGTPGLSVGCLGLGTVKWGRNQGLKHAPFELPDDATCLELLDMASAAGANLLDTAPAYGIAEERIGRLLSGRREQFLLFSKVGESFMDGKSSWDFSAESVRRSVEQSLRNLQTDHLDGVLLHCPREDLATLTQTPALEVLHTLKQQGKIRYVGVSTMSLEGGLAAVPLCDVLMVAWNTGFTEQQPVIEAASLAGKGILLKKVLSSGDLSGPPPPAGLSAAAHRLRSALALPGRPVVIAGTVTPAHFRENLAAAAAGPWP
ncbi:MAG: aldo/keto reductase [Verrucomicrobiales bacterium]|nr:aldo/keto reductase [Verrucomicrobiales bacterium]